MRRLCENGLESGLRRFVEKERPLLGICLGMQLLMTESQEFGLHRGLDILKGTVRRFREPLAGEVAFKIPHIGWSTAERVTEGGTKESNGPAALFQGIPVGTFFYFVHSFFCVPEDPQAIFSRTDYGRDRFCSVVNRHSVWGCQFHPEKSGPDGMQLYHNFLFNL
jgi:glutamine amidotransferase